MVNATPAKNKSGLLGQWKTLHELEVVSLNPAFLFFLFLVHQEGALLLVMLKSRTKVVNTLPATRQAQ